METSEQLEKFRDFFESYKDRIHEMIARGGKSVLFDFKEILTHDPELADLLLEDPENLVRAAELSLENLDLPSNFIKVRFHNLPSTNTLRIRDIRSIHLDRFIAIEGLVRQTSDVRPQVTSAKFECPSCGNTMLLLQIDTQFREPSRCSCGRKGRFRLIHKELIDAQRIVLEESPETLEGGEQPKRLAIFLKGDLVDPKMEKRTAPGTKVKITGIVKEVALPLRTGGHSTRYDLVMESNYIEPIEETFEEINITKEEEEEILEASKDPRIYQRLVSSIAPSIYGHEDIKAALILQLMGGVQKIHDDGTKRRGDMHVLLIGDPGSGKSQMLQFISKIAPKARLVSGKGASSAGLCVSPKSIVLTNPGGMEEIKSLVEKRIQSNTEYIPGVWKRDNINDIKIQSLSKNFKLHSQNPQSIWRLKSPWKLVKVTLSSGKTIELTQNTKLLSIKNKGLIWKRSRYISEGDYIATPRKLIGGNINELAIVDLIDSNPVVHNIKGYIKKINQNLTKKYGTLRKAAQELGINENQLYHHWVNENARGNIKLNNLRKLCTAVGMEWKSKVRKISLYNGKPHSLPAYLNKETLYLAGLIAGDGDIRHHETNTYSIRFSNSNSYLQETFNRILNKEFSLKTDIQKGNKHRPTASRTNSKILGGVLLSLGIPISPKSHRIILSNTLLHLSNSLLSEYIAGLYDADGSICFREKGGSSCVELTTCSERLARQLQLVLLRFEIHSHLRKRKASEGKIKGRYSSWVLEVWSNSNILKFAENIPLRHQEKKEKLDKILGLNKTDRTYTDTIPYIDLAIKEELQKQRLSLRKNGWYKNLSRIRAQKILSRIEQTPSVKKLKKICYGDIFWEKVKKIQYKMAKQNYVYDLTVKNSHNFVVDGILVHNTATVVKDEFLRGWALEAGAFVLANGGFCVSGDTEILLDKNRIRKISDLYEESDNYEEFKVQTLDMDTFEVIHSKIKTITRRFPKRLYFIELDTGDKLKITEEHPLPIWDNGVVWKKVKDINPGDIIISVLNYPSYDEKLLTIDYLPEDVFVRFDINKIKKPINKKDLQNHLNIPEHRLYFNNKLTIKNIKDICKFLNRKFEDIKEEIEIEDLPKYINEELMEFLGLIITDGSISKTKFTIRFYSKNIELKERYMLLVQKLFKITPTTYIDNRSGVYQLHFSSSHVHNLITSFGIIKGNKSKSTMTLERIRDMSQEYIKSFMLGVINGDGSISNRKFGGCINIVSGNRLTAETYRKLLRKIGVISHKYSAKSLGGGIIKKGVYEIFGVTITGVSNISSLRDNRLLSYKLNVLEEIIKRHDRSFTIPKVDKLFTGIREKLPHFEKHLLYRNSLRIANLKKFGIKRSNLINMVGILSKANPVCYTHEYKLLKKVSDNQILFTKVKLKEEINPEYVYNMELDRKKDPNYFANFIPIHNCIIDEMDKINHEDTSALHQALEQQIITIAKANIQACYSSDTEVLTENGWKKYTEVKKSKIAQFNPNDESIKFMPHKGLFVYNYNDKMYKFKNKRNDILVTPNHRMLAKSYHHKDYRVYEARDLKYNYIQFLNSGKFIGHKDNYFILPPIKHKQKRRHQKYIHQHRSKKIPMELWLEFLGYYLSEGGIQKKPTIGIPQKSGNNLEKIKKCLSSLSKYVGFTLSETKDGIYTRFQITNTQLFEFLEKHCGKKCKEKRFPINLSSLSREQLKILYDAMMLGDGCSKGKYFSSISKDLIDLFQAVAFLIEKSANKGLHYKGKLRGNRQDCYRISLSNKIRPTIRKKDVKVVDYNGKVFCFSTNTGFFVTRRNGKIAIQGNTLKAQTTLLAAANPKLGRFDPYLPIASQINMPSTLINRFDLIFPIRDMPSKEFDTRVATHILMLQQKPEDIKAEFSPEFLKKYISYARQKIKPALTKEAVEEIKSFYVNLRNLPSLSEQELKPIPISARQLEALVRLAEGSARVRLSKKVMKKDAQMAIETLKRCLMQVGFDPESGQIDIDRISTGITTSQRSKIVKVQALINELTKKIGKRIPIDDLIMEAAEQGINEEQVNEAIDILKRDGTIFQPTANMVEKI